MTSNCGVVTQKTMGLGKTDDKLLSIDMRVVKRYFVPEFIGRLDGIIQFNPLTEVHAGVILDKFIKEFNDEHLSPKGTMIKVSDEAKNRLIKSGFNYEYGARPLKNILNKTIKVKIADLLIDNDVDSPDTKFTDTILVDYYDNDYHVTFVNTLGKKVNVKCECEEEQ
jgi:ATP-dependent Clp protease ATP-binding subunit ClpA